MSSTIPARAGSRPATSRTPGSQPQLAESDEWANATPFRAWVRQLVSDTGLSWRVIARAAGVPTATVLALLRGRQGRPLRRLRQVDGIRLLRLNHNKLSALAKEPASSKSLRVLACALGSRGCGTEHVAKLIGTDIRTARTLMAGGPVWCSRLQHLRAEAACEAFGIDPDQLLRARASVNRRTA